MYLCIITSIIFVSIMWILHKIGRLKVYRHIKMHISIFAIYVFALSFSLSMIISLTVLHTTLDTDNINIIEHYERYDIDLSDLSFVNKESGHKLKIDTKQFVIHDLEDDEMPYVEKAKFGNNIIKTTDYVTHLRKID